MFFSTKNKGFQMHFSNGYYITVQWGPGNYCARQAFGINEGNPMKEAYWQSETAEIAIFNKEGSMQDLPNQQNQSIGYLDADDVACLINWLYNKPDSITLEDWQTREPCRIFTRTNF